MYFYNLSTKIILKTVASITVENSLCQFSFKSGHHNPSKTKWTDGDKKYKINKQSHKRFSDIFLFIYLLYFIMRSIV